MAALCILVVSGLFFYFKICEIKIKTFVFLYTGQVNEYDVCTR